MLDLKLWVSRFNTITKTICVLSLWWWPCHAQFIFGQTCSLSCGIHISCFHSQVWMTGSNHGNDLMLHRCIKNWWNIPFGQPHCMVFYHKIIGAEISYWIQLEVLKQQQVSLLTGTTTIHDIHLIFLQHYSYDTVVLTLVKYNQKALEQDCVFNHVDWL